MEADLCICFMNSRHHNSDRNWRCPSDLYIYLGRGVVAPEEVGNTCVLASITRGHITKRHIKVWPASPYYQFKFYLCISTQMSSLDPYVIGQKHTPNNGIIHT